MKSSRSSVLFASAHVERLDRDLTLPAKFGRLLDRLPIRDRVQGKRVAVKMHLGWGLGYSTVHPLFVRLLIDHIRQGKPKDIFITDGNVAEAAPRGYSRQTVGARLEPAFGKDGKAVRRCRTGWKPVPSAMISRVVTDADILINLSHTKAHGDAGYGGACKNLSMGCVTAKTRGDIHALEGDLTWNRDKCIRCGKCIEECPTKANRFDDKGEYHIFWHNCKMCRHCMLICPTDAIQITKHDYDLFQEGLARMAMLVLKSFRKGNVFHVNVLTHVTIFCDCWGMTTPALVPDIGIMASEDMVAIDDASLRAIKVKNLIPGAITPPFALGKGRHLFEKLHGRDPFAQVRALEALDAGSSDYRIVTVR